MLISVSLMFMIAQKITNVEEMFIDDDPLLTYIISALHVQYKIIQISFLGHRANMMVKSIHKLCCKLYNKVERIELLDIDTDVVKLGCGFFNFDWDVTKIVVSTEIIYFVTMVQFQQLMNEK
ncbi:hypothetical protein ACKWTF_006540 [Chironomus riparius]